MAHKTPKYIRKRRGDVKPKKGVAGALKPWEWKYWLELLVGVLGVLLTIATMKAQPSMSLEPPLDPRNVMSTQFVVDNDTWFDFESMQVAAISTDITTTLIHADEVSSGWTTLPIPKELKSGDRETIPHPLRATEFGGRVLSGKFGLVISYRPKWLPFLERRKGFLFTIGVQADGNSRFQQQPGEQVERDYSELEKTHPFSDSRP